MKHPKHEILQDYFENVLNAYHENLVKEHLLDCDQCTEILSHFAVIETKLKNQKAMAVSEMTRNKIFSEAKNLLKVKQDKKVAAEALVQSRTDKREKLQKGFQEGRESIFPELKIPALQLCSLSIVLFVLVAVEKGQGGEAEMYEPLNSEVEVFTYTEMPNEAEE
ncbi:MAG: hypothetical protein H0V66_03555 [Bdellovibrionales bacterium]|nr:hypothetical protein [Bdellovibrionales bacterium]